MENEEMTNEQYRGLIRASINMIEKDTPKKDVLDFLRHLINEVK